MNSITHEDVYLKIEVFARDEQYSDGGRKFYATLTSKSGSPRERITLEEEDIKQLVEMLDRLKKSEAVKDGESL